MRLESPAELRLADLREDGFELAQAGRAVAGKVVVEVAVDLDAVVQEPRTRSPQLVSSGVRSIWMRSKCSMSLRRPSQRMTVNRRVIQVILGM